VPFLGEVLSPWQLLGAVLVIGAIFAMQLGKTR
jgi:drug/metabolite transporter (DMT)-like permease